MEQEQLLAEAKARYPIGTKFRIAHDPRTVCTVKSHKKHEKQLFNEYGPLHINFLVEEYVSTGTQTVSCSVYADKWAEVVSYPPGFVYVPELNLQIY